MSLFGVEMESHSSRSNSVSSRPGSGCTGSRSLLTLSVNFLRRVDAMRGVILCPVKLKDVEMSPDDGSALEGHVPSDLYDCFQMLLNLQQQMEDGPSSCEPETEHCFTSSSDSQRSLDSAYNSSTSSLDKLETLSESSDGSQPATRKPDTISSSFGASLVALCRCLRQATQLCALVERHYLRLLG